MKIFKKKFLALFFVAALVSLGSASGDEMAMTSGMGMGVNMVPFHIAEILIAIAVSVLVLNVITATGQKNVFIYLPIGMALFAAASVVGYSPHLGFLQVHEAELGAVALNTVGLALMGVSFYKWKNLLGEG